jgi:anti-sigma factor RsiW
MNAPHLTAEQLIDYVHAELCELEDAAVHAHLAACAVCREEYDAEVRLSELLREHARARELELPPELAATIRDLAARPAHSPWIARWNGLLRPAFALPVAAAAAVGLYVGAHVLHDRSPAARIDAAYYLEDHASLATTAPFSDGMNEPSLLAAEVSGAPGAGNR